MITASPTSANHFTNLNTRPGYTDPSDMDWHRELQPAMTNNPGLIFSADITFVFMWATGWVSSLVGIGGGSSSPDPLLVKETMTWFYITLPLMVLAIGIATLPVLYYSIREHRLIHGQRTPARSNSKSSRSDYWTRSVSHHEIRARRQVTAGQEPGGTIVIEVGEATTPGDGRDEAAGEDQDQEEERAWERIYA